VKKHAKTLLALAILCTLAIVALELSKERPNPHELTLWGNVEIRQVDLGFRVGGRIAKMFFEEGDEIKKGDLLAILDDAPYRAALERTRGEVSANAALVKDATAKYGRNLPLCYDGTVSKQECDTLLNNKDNAKGALAASRGALRQAQIDVGDSKIYAPANGIITTRIQEPGAIVSGSQPVYTLNKAAPVWIRAYIPEIHLANVKYGMRARVLTDSKDPNTGHKREYTGWVGYISPVAEFTPKTVQTQELRTDLVYRVRVYIYDIDAYLRQGMPTTIKIDLRGENGD
jgi:HlyD family secretion protein